MDRESGAEGAAASLLPPLTPAVRRELLRVVALVVALIGAYAVLPMRGPRAWIGAIVGVVAVVGVFPLAVRRARAILGSEQPLLDAIEAIALLSTLLVLGFAAVYFSVSHDAGQIVGVHTRLDAVYFALVTLSTVGFGDVHATGQLARGVVVTQIVVDLVFIGVAIRMVSSATRLRVEGRRANG